MRACVALAVCFGLALPVLSGAVSAAEPSEVFTEDGVGGAEVGHVRPGLATEALHDVWGAFSSPRGLRPLSELRWEGVVRQQLDAGCGPASMATLYTHYLDLPVTEVQMARSLAAEAFRRNRTRRDIQQRGYSLLDLKHVAERGRLVTAALRGTPENLAALKIPVLTHINIRGYGHYVVLRGLVGDRVILADPFFGNLTLPVGQFRELWSGVMLALGRPKDLDTTPELDPRGGPTTREIDFATFRRGPALPPQGTRLPLWWTNRVSVYIEGLSIPELDDLALVSVGQTGFQLRVD